AATTWHRASEHERVAGFLVTALGPHQRALYRPEQAQECSSIVPKEHPDGNRHVWAAKAAPAALAVEDAAARSPFCQRLPRLCRRGCGAYRQWWHDPRPFYRFGSARFPASRRRRTSPMEQRSRPTHSKTWRTTRASSHTISKLASPAPSCLVT